METRNCQNCEQDFNTKQEDFTFYEKIKVPPPTFCPRCRFIRRMSWRNERTLYKRNCDLCNKAVISMYPKDTQYKVYCTPCWWGDGWDPTEYGKDYDFSRPFFEQFNELLKSVPAFALFQSGAINSDYSNMIGRVKNAYLSVSVVKGSENVFYSKCVDSSKDIMDSHNIINGSEQLYENIEAQNNYNSQHTLLCRGVIDSYFLFDCNNCSNCVLSSNLRNKQYYIRNKQYSKDEYFKELERLNLKSRSSRKELLKEFEDIKRNSIFRFANINKCSDVTGDNLLNVKNSYNCFQAYDIEDAKYCFRIFNVKDALDMDYGGDSELMYECTTGAIESYNARFSHTANSNVRNAEYTHCCTNISDVFGCAGLKNKKYAILNKVYPKEEFFALRDKIIRQMNDMPYLDKNGREYKYGEFFPHELSPFSYNESAAQEIEPLTEEEIKQKGFNWRAKEPRDIKITISAGDVPDNIDDVDESILNEVLECVHKGTCKDECTEAFRLTNYELSFYKKHGIPVPDLCPNCRYRVRLAVMPGEVLYKRSCMNSECKNEFETAYSPDRPEKIYCENCYNKEVY